MFLQTRALQLIVFDAESETNATTPDRITGETVRNVQLPYWVDSVERLSPESAFLIVRNKMDDKRFALPSATSTYIAEWREAGHIYQEVIATSGTGIPVLKGQLIEAARQLPEYGMEMPKSWDQVRSFFWKNLKKPKRKRLISRDYFNTVCTKYGVLRGSELALLRYLHRTGTVYYDEKNLNDTIIADQEWAIEAIYKLLDRESRLYNDLKEKTYGKERVEAIFTAFGAAYTTEQRWLFLSLMQSCGLCFPLKESRYQETNLETYYIFPDFLPAVRPETVQYELTNRADQEQRVFQQQVDFLPYYHIQQLIAQWGVKTPIWNVWRTGLRVSTSEVNFILEADLVNHTLTLSVAKTLSDEWLTVLLQDFSYNNREWYERTATDDAKPVVPADLPLAEVQTKLDSLPDVKQPAIKRLVASYAKEDQRYVDLLGIRLKMRGQLLEFWGDWKIAGNESWQEEIPDEFETCDGYVIFVSNNYMHPKKEFIHEKEIPIMSRRWQQRPRPFVYVIHTIPFSTEDTSLEPFKSFKKGEIMPDPKKKELAASAYMEQFWKECIKNEFLSDPKS